MILILIFVEDFCNTMLYMIFQYVSETVIIQRLSINCGAILEKVFCMLEWKGYMLKMMVLSIKKQFSWSTAKTQHNFSKNILALADSCNPVEVYPYGLLYMWSLLTFTKPNLTYYKHQKYVFSLENIVSKYDIWVIAII